MITVTIKYGATNTMTKEVESGILFEEIITDSLLAALNAPESVVAVVNGDTYEMDDEIPAGASYTINLERQSAKKAV